MEPVGLGINFVIEVIDPRTGGVLSTVQRWSNLDTNNREDASWRDFRATISEDYSGQTIVLRWTSVTDQTLNTNFLFDTLTLKPSSCYGLASAVPDEF